MLNAQEQEITRFFLAPSHWSGLANLRSLENKAKVEQLLLQLDPQKRSPLLDLPGEPLSERARLKQAFLAAALAFWMQSPEITLAHWTLAQKLRANLG